MPEDKQQEFFVQVAKEKEASKKSQFSYQRVKETLTKIVTDQLVKQRSVTVGGTFWPLSVYKAKGYDIQDEEAFCARNPSQWNAGLGQWTCMLAEVSISECEIRSTVEKSILQSEKAIKKRKAAAMTEAEAEAVESKSAKSASVAAIMDLVTESEDEGQAH